MSVLFYVAAAVAVLATVRVVTCTNAVHALLYFIVSLLASASIFFVLGAPFIAALEVIIYAGAIMVLFMFVVMLLHSGAESVERERQWLNARMWWGPCFLAVVLLAQLLYAIERGDFSTASVVPVSPTAVGAALYGPYLLGVELGSMLLLAGLVGAYHLGRRIKDGKGESQWPA